MAKTAGPSIRPYREGDADFIVSSPFVRGKACSPGSRNDGTSHLRCPLRPRLAGAQARDIRHGLAQAGTATWVAEIDSIPVGFAVAI